MEYKQEQKEFTVTVDNTCTNHCTKPSHLLRHFIYWFLTFSDIDFWMNSVEDGRTLRVFKLWKANWTASLYCAAITCHTSLRARVSLVQACLGQLALHGESLNHDILHLVWVSHRCTYRCTQNRLVFIHNLANSRTPYTLGKLTVFSLMPYCPILNKEYNSCNGMLILPTFYT